MPNGGLTLNHTKHINIRNFWKKELNRQKFVPPMLMTFDFLSKPNLEKDSLSSELRC